MPRKVKARKVKTNVYIDRDLLKKLKKLAAQTDVPMARLIRRGIVMVLDKQSKK
jgi:post-segregation antitoxin (ccd killing protein)